MNIWMVPYISKLWKKYSYEAADRHTCYCNISTWHWYCLLLQKLHKYWKNQLELKNKVVVYLYSIRDLKVFYGRHLCFEKKAITHVHCAYRLFSSKICQRLEGCWKGGMEKKFAQLELRFKMLRDSKYYCLQRVQIYNKMLWLQIISITNWFSNCWSDSRE